jgi:hypothetical protein
MAQPDPNKQTVRLIHSNSQIGDFSFYESHFPRQSFSSLRARHIYTQENVDFLAEEQRIIPRTCKVSLPSHLRLIIEENKNSSQKHGQGTEPVRIVKPNKTIFYWLVRPKKAIRYLFFVLLLCLSRIDRCL